jgi:hypothetical protein
MGVVVEDCPELAADAGKYFEAWWAFAALSPTSVQVFDPVARIDRRVPPWSILVPAEQRAQSTLAGGKLATACNWNAPLSLDLGGERGTVLLTGCPQEVLDSGRTWDQEGLVRTIDDARKSICVSVMDFAPVGLFGRQSAGATLGSEGVIPYNTPVYVVRAFRTVGLAI